MTHLNIHDAKTHLSRIIEQVEKGETVTLCRRNKPVAEIRPLGKPAAQSRQVGLASDKGVALPASFFEKLPEAVIAAFEGRGQ